MHRLLPSALPLKDLLAFLVMVVFVPLPVPAQEAKNQGKPHLLLITLDTTRADSLGSYQNPTPTSSATPVLDGLARRGLRYRRAVSPSPLTLPAHASLLTGLDPPAHGLRDNGLASLPTDLPTLATILAEQGYTNAAFVGSRVLDRRFGLARGFDHYDDHLSAEQVGEYGYPERRAHEVVDAALAWLDGRTASKPLFLWLHFYDAHAPYDPPVPPSGPQPKDRYRDEVAFVDRQIGRFLEGLRTQGIVNPLIAVVADHGEALGEHGERTHGLFLYRAVLEVPLILAGPGIPRGRVVQDVTPTRRLAATLLDRLGLAPSSWPTPPLPGPWTADGERETSEGIFSETWLPATAYGWSPLEALTLDRWRLIVAPEPELYDVEADPDEAQNQIQENQRQARRMKHALEAYKENLEPRTAVPTEDAELLAQLRRLGYLSGASGQRAGTLDPKVGLELLDEFEEAKNLLGRGQLEQALRSLHTLVKKNPENVPFRTHLARALLAAGKTEEGLVTLRSAVDLNPRLDFLHLQLAEAYRGLGRTQEAKEEYHLATQLNPRMAAAWLGLAEIAHRGGAAAEEARLLRQAAANGTLSAPLFLRLGQIEISQKNDEAHHHLRRATELAPRWPMAWWVRGQALWQSGQNEESRRVLETLLRLAPRSAEARQAQRLLRQKPIRKDGREIP